MIDGVPVNYVRETSLPVNEQALEWENEDGTLHEGQSEGWENEVLTMDFCSGTLQSFLHRNPIEASMLPMRGCSYFLLMRSRISLKKRSLCRS